ncbi:MAG: hypothetical protein A3G18_04575 [Rhodospirillales bacterium RIFCSPLOWO2_12_FULL_58_28]|nr:MAG: hypothetical protein A3H92_09365 [Rhodospirillales bacterium RIFCSPLOWO2_02_FULL_58_16]OHC76917.1 MAG: hypothetical protein A3G18_04575 [Rhodospirillales bacterium RIFCSPLOWO2_12_FULL_58_28]
MNIAFYAPLKPPDHPNPSGDRRMARLLMDAMERAGHTVEQASGLRSYDREGDAVRQRRMRDLGGRMAKRLIRRYQKRPARSRPQVWFTYHLYHKAPDWLGPAVSAALGIPYVIAEASFAPKQENGPWAEGHDAALRAIALADLVFCLNSNDRSCVQPMLKDPSRLIALAPFIDTEHFAYVDGADCRRRISEVHGIEPNVPWLLTVAMMRPGAKSASYSILGEALAKLMERPWRLLACGYGTASKEVAAALAPLGDRVTWFKELTMEELARLYAASDIYAWPAVDEAYGMAFLEAQAAGLPVVAGRAGGVPDIVSDGLSGILVPVNDAALFAAAVDELIGDAAKRRAMGKAARRLAFDKHDIKTAVRVLNDALCRLTAS